VFAPYASILSSCGWVSSLSRTPCSKALMPSAIAQWLFPTPGETTTYYSVSEFDSDHRLLIVENALAAAATLRSISATDRRQPPSTRAAGPFIKRTDLPDEEGTEMQIEGVMKWLMQRYNYRLGASLSLFWRRCVGRKSST